MTAREPYIGPPVTRFRVMGRDVKVDAAPVRDHVQSLFDSDMTRNMVARAAGLSNRALYNLMTLRPETALLPAANALLSVSQRPSHHQAIVLAYGLRRRVEALAAMGWDVKSVAAECGVPFPSALHRARDSVRVKWSMHAAVAAGYERISHVRRDDNRALMKAARHGYLSPLMWDDIDDYFEVPGSTPVDVGVDEVLVQRVIDGIWIGEVPPLERRAAFEKLHARGLSAPEIAERLHVTPRTVERLRAAA
ncbi:helix-turn-helix domain-containing protein [Rhodococcus erythropolis]|uniref:helix-turn-helix domain-containing protein n=1 Tax=Rhodococcus erythropolis TaxID=1833 RepID=UPI00294A27C8|nr:helix-turn-helix domain-containing protein [Rhodococcus erythropolis]MDV6274059.1 helix-turn-helix domain-containing protein [Rhodococcus erythropolis]